MDAANEIVELVGDADGFQKVLARTTRKKHRKTESHGDGTDTSNSDAQDKVQHVTLCKHFARSVPAEHFEAVVTDLQREFLTVRGIMDSALRPMAGSVAAFLRAFSHPEKSGLCW